MEISEKINADLSHLIPIRQMVASVPYDGSPEYDTLLRELQGVDAYHVLAMAGFKGNIGAAERIIELHGDLSRYNTAKVILVTEQTVWLTSSMDLLPHFPETSLRDFMEKLHKWGLSWQVPDKKDSGLSSVFKNTRWYEYEKAGVFKQPGYKGELPSVSEDGLRLENPELLIAFNEEAKTCKNNMFREIPCWIPDSLVSDFSTMYEFEPAQQVRIEGVTHHLTKDRDIILKRAIDNKKDISRIFLGIRASDIFHEEKIHWSLHFTLGLFLNEKQKFGMDFPSGKTLCWVRASTLNGLDFSTPSSTKLDIAKGFSRQHVSLVAMNHNSFNKEMRALGLFIGKEDGLLRYPIGLIHKGESAEIIKSLVDQRLFSNAIKYCSQSLKADDLIAFANLGWDIPERSIIEITDKDIDRIESITSLPKMDDTKFVYKLSNRLPKNNSGFIDIVKTHSYIARRLYNKGITADLFQVPVDNVGELLNYIYINTSYDMESIQNASLAVAHIIDIGLKETLRHCTSIDQWKSIKPFFDSDEIFRHIDKAPNFVKRDQFVDDLGI